MSFQQPTEDTGQTDLLIDELTKHYPQYAEKAESFEERKKLDWDLCGSGVFSETILIDAYQKYTSFGIKDEESLTQIATYPDITSEYLENNCCLPCSWDEDGNMEILVSDPYSTHQISYIFKRLHNREVTFSLLRRNLLERLIQETYNNDTNKSPDDDNYLDTEGDEETLRSLASEAKVVRFVNEIFSRAVEAEASDIHIEPEEKSFSVRFRVDGILQEFFSGALSQYPAIASRVKLIGGLNIAESRLPQDGRTNIQVGGSDIDIRISTIPVMNGESIVLRILRKDALEFDLENIGMGKEMIEEFEKLIKMPHGIVLVVGPTGSGKTTTLYTIMTMLNNIEKKIITIEDPVEYKIAGLSQMQVNPKIGLDFASGLRNIVRQDPDVILVGEIRDKETANIAINAALTGHLVLSTLHTNDAPGAVSRLLDMGVEGFLISSSLNAVLSQRLIRTLCSACNSAPDQAPQQECRICNGSGFRGRTAIFEFLVVNDEIRSSISANADSSTIATIAKTNGMKTLLEDGKTKVDAGKTTEAELLRAAFNQ